MAMDTPANSKGKAYVVAPHETCQLNNKKFNMQMCNYKWWDKSKGAGC